MNPDGLVVLALERPSALRREAEQANLAAAARPARRLAFPWPRLAPRPAPAPARCATC